MLAYRDARRRFAKPKLPPLTKTPPQVQAAFHVWPLNSS